MTPAQLAGRLGLAQRLRSWAGACPACDYARAFCLKPGKDGTVRLFCANGCDRPTLEAAVVRATGDGWTPKPPADADTVQAARSAKQAAALRLWAGSEPAASTIVDAYLTGRALPGLATSPALRFRGDCPHPEGGRLPAMVASVVDVAGAPIALHRTYLARDGRSKADADPPRASLGPIWGGAVRLAPLDPARPLVIGEGIETAASAGRLAGCPAWAALSAGNLARGLSLPLEARRVVVAVDPDGPGERAAAEAARRWQGEGRTVALARPDGAGDFNDVLAREVTHGR